MKRSKVKATVADWTRAGRQLAKVDPAMFARLLAIAESTVAVHADPIGSTVDIMPSATAWGRSHRGAA